MPRAKTNTSPNKTPASASGGEVFVELLSEEIPARMQRRAASDLADRLTSGLTQAGLAIGPYEAHCTPRRLAVQVAGVPAQSPAVEVEKKGPRVGAPEKAVAGFLRAAGLQSLGEAQIETDPKKGDFYVARAHSPGRPTPSILVDLLPEIIEKFPWPKSMRWGNGNLLWVRPLRGIVCLYGGDTVSFKVGGLESGNVTVGHRFMAPEQVTVRDFAGYTTALEKARVLLDHSARREKIASQITQICAQEGVSVVDDPGLLDENAGLNEWPTVFMGSFDESFLSVPREALVTSLREHQKVFCVRAEANTPGAPLANRFLMVSNIVPADGGATLIAGNERVIRARLSDAKFFWDQDRQTPLDEMATGLASVTFHAKLGSVADRVNRITQLAAALAPDIGADEKSARRAAQLCKADLVSGMVGEFPELQGIMGRYYAIDQELPQDVADAIGAHYRPQGPGDDCPSAPVSMAVALADKLELLTGMWSVDEKPTGSKDPYALRRAALGVVRIILENNLRLSLSRTTGFTEDLLAFFADRLKVYLRDQGARHDLIDAVFALPDQDDLTSIVMRVNALGAFLESENGEALLAGTKRAGNILRKEEKNDRRAFDGAIDPSLLQLDEERALAERIETSAAAARKAIANEDFAAAMDALAQLRAPVDRFFDEVTVNADDPAVRVNRLNLLNQIRVSTRTVADFSKIAGS